MVPAQQRDSCRHPTETSTVRHIMEEVIASLATYPSQAAEPFSKLHRPVISPRSTISAKPAMASPAMTVQNRIRASLKVQTEICTAPLFTAEIIPTTLIAFQVATVPHSR